MPPLEEEQGKAVETTTEVVAGGSGITPDGDQRAERRVLYRGLHEGKRVELRDGDKVYRSYQIDPTLIDVEKRMVRVTFSSEAPVDRGWCREILDHSPGAVRMHRFQNRAQVLVEHTPKDVVAVIESAEITEDRLGQAWDRFGRSAFAEEIFQDVVDGIRSHISVGYIIHDLVETKLPGGGLELRVTDWEPFEHSIVSIPADSNPLVGIGRAFGSVFDIPDVTVKEERSMPPEANTVDREKLREEIRAEEAARTTKMRALAAELGLPSQFADKHINENTDFTEYRFTALEEAGRGRRMTHEQVREASKLGMSDKEIQRYSLHRMLEAQLTGDWSHAGLELEAHNETQKRSERSANGKFIPYDVLAAKRDINVADGSGQNASGAKLVGTDHLAGDFIDILRPNSALASLGMRVIDGLTGNVEIPRRSGSATVFVFNNETGTVTESTPTFDNISASPTTIGVQVDITRRQIQQSSPAVEALTLDDIAQQMGLKIDYLGLRGSGTAPEPYGLVYTSGIGSVAGGNNGAAPDWADIVGLETKVNVKNALLGNLAYLFSPKVKGFLKTTEKASGTAQFLMGENDMVNGYRALTTTQMRDDDDKGTSLDICSHILFGNFQDAILFLWGGMDVLLDKTSLGNKGGLRIYTYQDMWFAVRHAESFAAMLDALC